MKPLFYVILVLFCYCCKNSPTTKVNLLHYKKIDSILRTRNFNPNTTYKPLSLHYKGKSFLSPNQTTNTLKNTFSYRPDPNGEFSHDFNYVKDYLSIDDNLSINLTQGSVNGILFFSSDQKYNRIFSISGYWTIDSKLIKDNPSEIITQISKQLFPVLKGKFELKKNWNYQHKKDNYIEHFSIETPDENSLFWNLHYKIHFLKEQS